MRKRWHAACLLTLCLLISVALAEEWLPPLGEMPQIWIDTRDGSSDFAVCPVRDTKLQGAIQYVDAVITVTGGGEDLREAPAQVKARGNYTLEYPKKSIRIKFNKKQTMLGLHGGEEYKNWVLLAEWKDLSLIHSPLGFYLAHVILGADGYYVSDCRNVEVWINGEYWGVYLLAEQQEVKNGRTRLAEVPADYTGTDIGYFFEYDAYFMEETIFGDSGDPVFQIYHDGIWQDQFGYTVKSDLNSSRQRRYLAAYVRRAYQAARSAVTGGLHYAFNETGTKLTVQSAATVEEAVGRVLDLRSLTDMYILAEITCNPDLAWSSFYITLDCTTDGDGRLTFEAPWDFDSAFGIRADYESSTGFYVPGKGNPWMELVAGQEWFQERVRARWQELAAEGVPQKALQLILEHRNAFQDAYDRNYERWPQRIIEGNHELIDEVNQYTTQKQASDYLYRWLQTRLEWLDSQWGGGTASPEKPKKISGI